MIHIDFNYIIKDVADAFLAQVRTSFSIFPSRDSVFPTLFSVRQARHTNFLVTSVTREQLRDASRAITTGAYSLSAKERRRILT